MNDGPGAPITVRPAVPADAAAIGAIFDAAVRAGWTYLGELVDQPMFAPEDWDQLVADHRPPNALLVADHRTDGVVGYAAVHPGIALTAKSEHRNSAAPTSESCAS